MVVWNGAGGGANHVGRVMKGERWLWVALAIMQICFSVYIAVRVFDKPTAEQTTTPSSSKGTIVCYSGSRMIYNAEFSDVQQYQNRDWIEVTENSGVVNNIHANCIVTYK